MLPVPKVSWDRQINKPTIIIHCVIMLLSKRKTQMTRSMGREGGLSKEAFVQKNTLRD